MPVEVFLLTVVTDEAGRVIMESRAPFGRPGSPTKVSEVAKASEVAKVSEVARANPNLVNAVPGPLAANPLSAAPLPSYMLQSDVEDEEEAAPMQAAPVQTVAANSADVTMPPPIPLFETDRDVVEMFGKNVQSYQPQIQRVALGQSGEVELRAERGHKAKTQATAVPNRPAQAVPSGLTLVAMSGAMMTEDDASDNVIAA